MKTRIIPSHDARTFVSHVPTEVAPTPGGWAITSADLRDADPVLVAACGVGYRLSEAVDLVAPWGAYAAHAVRTGMDPVAVLSDIVSAG